MLAACGPCVQVYHYSSRPPNIAHATTNQEELRRLSLSEMEQAGRIPNANK